MTIRPAAFDEVASVFADYGTSLRGFVRYKLTQRNLEPYLPRRKTLRVLDVGGGNGPDAAWLAHLGHQVTLVEPSSEQREYAQRRFDFFLSTAARERIVTVASTLKDYKERDTYDLVLVHGVAMYQAQPEVLIKEAIERVRPGGLISIVEKNYWGAEARMVWRREFDGLKELQKTHRYINNLQQNVHAFLPEEIEAILKKAQFKVLEWSGIRVLVDEVRAEISALEQEVVDEIVELEHGHGHNPTIRGHGQMLHFIARKPRA
ncbi:MAG: SAM-dependent methyltransferase [Candidatus Saccharibacteria bacterium]|nr:SAM-dependent methyltransferase [Candidatus Saccharibacteria bacterium]